MVFEHDQLILIPKVSFSNFGGINATEPQSEIPLMEYGTYKVKWFNCIGDSATLDYTLTKRSVKRQKRGGTTIDSNIDSVASAIEIKVEEQIVLPRDTGIKEELVILIKFDDALYPYYETSFYLIEQDTTINYYLNKEGIGFYENIYGITHLICFYTNQQPHYLNYLRSRNIAEHHYNLYRN
jgi:hypothetical protein